MAKLLILRGIFGGGHSHDHHDHTCPAINESGPAIVPIAAGHTFHYIATCAAGAMMGFACVLSFALIMMHALRYSVPMEQKQIIRITFTIPVFAILYFLTILLESRAVYLAPLTDLYESWALAAFFLMLAAYVSGKDQERERILQENGTLAKYNRVWFFVFQQPLAMTVLVAAQEITEGAGVYCATSNKPRFAHVWIAALKALTTTFAIGAVLRFHQATKQLTLQQKPLLKLFSFKSIVLLSWIQTTLFSYLQSSGDLHANDNLTFEDFSVAIPGLIVCGEMVFFSNIFQFAYPVSPYTGHRKGRSSGLSSQAQYLGGFLGLRALFDALNITDLIIGILVAPRKLGSRLNDSRTGDMTSDELDELPSSVDNQRIRRPSVNKY